MRRRQIAYLSVGLLSLYLGVQGLSRLASAIPSSIRGGSIDYWFQLVAPGVTLLAAVLIWYRAEEIAARLGREFIFSRKELEEPDVHTEAEGDDDADAQESEAPVGRKMRAPAIALVVLGLYFIGGYLASVVVDAVQVAAHTRFDAECRGSTASINYQTGQVFPSAPCPFWTTSNTNRAAGLAGDLVPVAFGFFLIARRNELAEWAARRSEELEDEEVAPEEDDAEPPPPDAPGT